MIEGRSEMNIEELRAAVHLAQKRPVKSKLSTSFSATSPLSSAGTSESAIRSSISSGSSGTINNGQSYFPNLGSTPKAQSSDNVSVERDPFTNERPNNFHPSLEVEFPSPSIYDLTLMLSSDVGTDKFWTNVVHIFEKHYRASRIILTVPHDMTDVSNTPWGLKATWNSSLAEGFQPSRPRNNSSDSRNESNSDWENMEDFVDDSFDPRIRRNSEVKQEETNIASGVVFSSMQPLNSEQQPLLDHGGIRRVIERGFGIVVLSREFSDVDGHFQSTDITPGGSELTPAKSSLRPEKNLQETLRNPFSTSSDQLDTSKLNVSGPSGILRYEDFEQAACSLWSSSPAPSPAIQSDATRNPFFAKQETTSFVDESTFVPMDEEEHTPYDEKHMYPTIGTEGTCSVLHIPLIHPSTARQIALTGHKSPKGQVPIAILSFLSDVIPYPANLKNSLEAFAPLIATSLSQALSHSNILHQLAYSAKSEDHRGALSPGSTDSISVSNGLSNDAYELMATPYSNSSGTENSYFGRTATLRRGASEDNLANVFATTSGPRHLDEVGRTTSERNPEQSKHGNSNRKSSRPPSPKAHNQSHRRRQTTEIRSKSLLHSFGASLAASFHPAGTVNTPTRARASSNTLVQPSARLMRVIVDAIPVCVMTASPINGRITWVNDRTLAYTGVSAEDYLTGQWATLYKDDEMEFTGAWQTAIRSGEGFARQTRVRRFDGVYRWFMARAVPLRDSQGVVVHWFGTMMDVHDQKLAEVDASRQKETQASESKYRSLAEASPQIVFAASSRHGITYANTQWLRYSGKSLKETQGYAFFTQIHPEDRNKCFLPRDGQLKQDESLISEIRLREHTGEYKWHLVKCICSEKRLENDEEIWLGTCTDINDHKLLEQRLQEAKESAFKSVESKTRFLSNMSHEIRTPLIGITGMINFLLDTDLTAEQLDYAHTVQQSAEALLAVINDILDLSKVEAGMMKLAKEPFPVRAMVEDASELLSSLAISKGLELNYLVEEDVPELVVGDRIRLRQVLLNILGNAIKFTSEGEVFVRCYTVAAKHLKKDEIIIGWETIDSGPGFSEEEGNLLFKPFSQVDGSLTRKHGGTGLGLVISRQLAELHGGSITCTSTKGVGSTFTFTARFQIAPGGRMEEIETRNTLHRILTPSLNTIVKKPVAFEVLIISHSVWSTVALNHHVRVVIPRDVQSSIVTSDHFDASLKVIANVAQPAFTHIVVNLLDIGEVLRLIKAVHENRNYRYSQLLIVSTPQTRIAVLEDAARANIIIEPEQVFFVFKVIKPAKLSRFFDPSSERNESADTRRETAQQVVQTQKAVFDEIHGNVGNRGLHVLLVEDNPVNQKVMTKFCKKAALEVTTADDGLQCLEHFSKDPDKYSIILMDLHMPNLDGYQACAKVRELERNLNRPPVPIIALSANVMSDVAERCSLAGFTTYLSKPVAFAKLSAKIGELIGRT